MCAKPRNPQALPESFVSKDAKRGNEGTIKCGREKRVIDRRGDGGLCGFHTHGSIHSRPVRRAMPHTRTRKETGLESVSIEYATEEDIDHAKGGEITSHLSVGFWAVEAIFDHLRP